MCGIVGYVGPCDASALLLDGLKRLEYRGYDSAGLAIINAGQIGLRKSMGRLSNLEAVLEGNGLPGKTGIGHTRWATHGEPSEKNSHPHANMKNTIAVVHNGIIENYQELRAELMADGVVFISDTDTEVIPHLICRELRLGAPTFMDALRQALNKTRGAYALGVVYAEEPEKLYAARLGSPLIIGLGKGENFIASDVPAILSHVQHVIYLDDGELACLQADKIDVIRMDGSTVEPDIQKIDIRAEDADKAGFETFMLKEIHEQPRVLHSLFAHHVSNNKTISIDFGALDDSFFSQLERVMIVSCGTAYYAGLYGKLLLEHLTDIAAEVDFGSEFRYRSPKLKSNNLIIAVSQSGETADTLASVRMAKSMGCKVLAICNVPGSTLVRESDAVLYTEAGPEIGVASTKAYTAQLMAFALLTLQIGRLRNEITEEQITAFIHDLSRVPNAIHAILHKKESIEEIADKHHDGPNALYLGRRFNYPTALEGALKNKEISYQHAEGYAAGEMKHGPIALINEYLPVICICTKTSDQLHEKMLSNMKEVEARHGRIIAVATKGDTSIEGWAEDIIYVPEVCEELSPIVNVVALQLLAYYAAQARGTDIDKPRNLAKSVTVE